MQEQCCKHVPFVTWIVALAQETDSKRVWFRKHESFVKGTFSVIKHWKKINLPEMFVNQFQLKRLPSQLRI